ncbi:hypothetical protein IG631_15512 [Alternaria alternata]|jgi:hypothetical protein|nr:hypothetical protein IG631_15512 [Alternaria alternata]
MHAAAARLNSHQSCAALLEQDWQATVALVGGPRRDRHWRTDERLLASSRIVVVTCTVRVQSTTTAAARQQISSVARQLHLTFAGFQISSPSRPAATFPYYAARTAHIPRMRLASRTARQRGGSGRECVPSSAGQGPSHA